ncbi:MAG: stage V sporulation protein AD [Clostridiales bacterium]|nr:stage V sporulation protein AD [Clostridiales bacterium]
MADNKLGRQTVTFKNFPQIYTAFSTAGKKEGRGPLGNWFDSILEDDKIGQKTWEEAETKMLKDTVVGAVRKAGIDKHEIDVIFSGDLINQLMSSSYAVRELGIPFLGLYGACSTMSESLIMAGAFVNAGYSKYAAAAASSHFCTAERQFRMPLAHGNQKPPSAQLTVTGCGCALLRESEGAAGCCEGKPVYVTGGTIGKIVDKGINDTNMMGAAMAPAAVDTIETHFRDTGRDPEFYDMIFTGDLGKIGKNIVKDMLGKKGFDMTKNYEDCGCMIYGEDQDAHSGGSGCGCSGSVLCGYIFQNMKKGIFKNVLIVSTGALLSTISTQQGESIPGIAHAVAISTEKERV